ncbi:hypothetical protein Dimus_017181 [Dionaea muscipula]
MKPTIHYIRSSFCKSNAGFIVYRIYNTIPHLNTVNQTGLNYNLLYQVTHEKVVRLDITVKKALECIKSNSINLEKTNCRHCKLAAKRRSATIEKAAYHQHCLQ